MATTAHSRRWVNHASPPLNNVSLAYDVMVDVTTTVVMSVTARNRATDACAPMTTAIVAAQAIPAGERPGSGTNSSAVATAASTTALAATVVVTTGVHARLRPRINPPTNAAAAT